VLVTNLYGSTNSVAATLTVNTPSSVTPPSGLVSWWRAEGNASDAIGTNNGVEMGNVAYVSGKVGMGFSLNGSNSYIRIASSPSLNMSNALTIELWYECLATDSNGHGIISKRNDESGPINYEITMNPNLNISVMFNDPTVVDSDHGGNFESSGLLYCSAGGRISSSGGNVPTGDHQLPDGTDILGWTASSDSHVCGESGARRWAMRRSPLAWIMNILITLISMAVIDDVSLYNRALSTNEIAAIYNAGTAGKTFTPVLPSITTQPQSQTNVVGGTATFVVVAGGATPLSYQWSVNGTVITNATNATLTLPNVQLSQSR